MSTNNFDPQHSTYEIWRAANTTVCLEDDLADIESAVAGKADSSHTHSNYAATSHTHDYAASSHTHSEYASSSHTHEMSAITGLETALNNKAATTHTHTAADVNAIDKSLQMLADNGNVEYEMTGLDVLEVFEDMPMGMHTGYCPVNSTNAPLSNEAWRFLMHRTGTSNYGWILAFGSYGSVYSNYVNNGTWRGWKNLVDGTSAPLWKHESNGGYYMTASQTVTPSKALDKCRNGWLLLWSDYDPGTSTTNNADFCTTTIPKRNGTGALWSGQGFFCTVPTYMTESTDVDNFHIKKVYVHNDKLVGYVGNNVEDRRDVVLRAVYEW